MPPVPHDPVSNDPRYRPPASLLSLATFTIGRISRPRHTACHSAARHAQPAHIRTPAAVRRWEPPPPLRASGAYTCTDHISSHLISLHAPLIVQWMHAQRGRLWAGTPTATAGVGAASRAGQLANLDGWLGEPRATCRRSPHTNRRARQAQQQAGIQGASHAHVAACGDYASMSGSMPLCPPATDKRRLTNCSPSSSESSLGLEMALVRAPTGEEPSCCSV